MARRRYNDFYQPEVVDPGAINFGSIQMYNPEDVDRMAQVGQTMQQRWDASQSVIAKQLEDIGAANINPRYKGEIIGKLERDLEDIYKNVSTTYQGDFGRAYNDIIKSLSKSRALLHGATQATAEEAKLRDQYGQLAMQNKAPLTYRMDEKTGKVIPVTQTFEDYYSINPKQSVFNEQGQFSPTRLDKTLRSAGEYEPYIERMVDHLMKQSVEEGLSRNSQYPQFLQQITKVGQDPIALRQLFNSDAPEAQAMVEDFVRNNPVAAQEFVDANGRFNENLAKDFLADALSSRVKQSKAIQNISDQLYINEERKRREAASTPQPLAELSGTSLGRSSIFTIDTFKKANPNSRAFISQQSGQPLKNVTYGSGEYGNGKITIDEYRAAKLERSIRKDNPVMQELFTKGSKTNEQLAKEAGFTSYEDYHKATWGKRNNPDDPKVNRYKELIAERNMAASTYSEELENKANEYITSNRWDKDLQFDYFSPSRTPQNMNEINAFQTAFRDKAITPDQFTFLNGNLAKKGTSEEDIAKAYKTDSGENIGFEMPMVGGDESIGLVWEVTNPDGIKSDAKWKTGYAKQANALRNVYGAPHLIKALNADVIQIGDKGNIKINEQLKDAPNVQAGLNKLTGLKALPASDDIDKFIVQFPEQGFKGQYAVIRERADGTEYFDYTGIESQASKLTKSDIFNILTLYANN